MDVVTTPPINLSPVSETKASWRCLDAQTPFDFTGWTAEFLIWHAGSDVFRVGATLTDSGFIIVTIPAGVAGSLPSCCRAGAEYQIRFTSPIPALDFVWRGPVVVLEIFA